jgi:hypothetical protein
VRCEYRSHRAGTEQSSDAISAFDNFAFAHFAPRLSHVPGGFPVGRRDRLPLGRGIRTPARRIVKGESRRARRDCFEVIRLESYGSHIVRVPWLVERFARGDFNTLQGGYCRGVLQGGYWNEATSNRNIPGTRASPLHRLPHFGRLAKPPPVE